MFDKVKQVKTLIVQEEKRRRDQRRKRRRRGVMKDTGTKAERRVRRETGIGVVIEIGISLNQSLGESKFEYGSILLTLCVILTTSLCLFPLPKGLLN